MTTAICRGVVTLALMQNMTVFCVSGEAQNRDVIGANAQADRAADVAKADAPNDVSAADLICGPRCVQYVLAHYGLPQEDLVELVREIQWPDLEKGASMKRIEEALQKRGVHTFGMQLAADASLDWPSPVIVHLKPENDDKIGHYVVRLPCSSDSLVSVWWGNRGIRDVSAKMLDDASSGAILLTSLQPISDPGAAVSRRSAVLWHSWLLAVAGSACILLIAIGCVWKKVMSFFRLLLKGEQL